MDILKTNKEVHLTLKNIRNKDKIIGFVPTMGALHQGHIALIKEAGKVSDVVIVSIFINPKQFNRKHDLDSYPRNLKKDIKLLESLNVDYLFAPELKEIYREPALTKVSLINVTDKLCASTRGKLFNGVALIITKLFNIISPNIAFFGLKDYQQYCIIRQLVRDLNFNVKVSSIETVREKSGLALSSRNQNLSKEQKNHIAPKLFHELIRLKDLIHNKKSIKKSIENIKNSLLSYGFSKIDYIEILNDDLSEYSGNTKRGRIFAAVFIGKVRLIDNIAL